MNRYRLSHVTEFSYDGPVSQSYNEVRLRPLQDELQTCISFRLNTTPRARPSTHTDYFGNTVHHFNVLEEHRRLRVEADSVVLVDDPRPLPGNGARLDDLDEAAAELDALYEFIAPTEFVPRAPEIGELIVAAESAGGDSVSGFVQAAADLVHAQFHYTQGATHVHSSICDSLATHAGVCQDFAHILLAIVRGRGIPGRYVSGYLMPEATSEAGANVEEAIGGQASHAWIEAYLPGAGWFGLDPTLGKPLSRRHVRVAYGRDYGDVPPVRGVYKGHAEQQLSVDVRVRPALDGEGHENFEETAAAGPEPPPDAPPQQQQQQQQQ